MNEICKICGHEFVALRFLAIHINKYHNKISLQEYYDQYLHPEEINIKCKCGNKRKFISLSQGYKNHCGNKECIKKQKISKYKNTCLKKYGVENYAQTQEKKEKDKKTFRKKYGVDHYMQCKEAREHREDLLEEKLGYRNAFQNEEIKRKIKTKNLQKYGVENPQQNSEIRGKTEQTNLKKYGNICSVQGEQQKEKTKKTNKEKYGNEIYQKSERYKNQVRTNLMHRIEKSDRVLSETIPLFSTYTNVKDDKKLPWKCTKCGNEFTAALSNGNIPRCFKCYPKLNGTSKTEIEIANFIEQYVKIERNKRFYDPSVKHSSKHKFELDIYIPSLNIGIEYDSFFIHCDLSGEKNSRYHLNKTEYFESMGIQTIHIFENEWFNKQDIVKSILLSKINKNEKIIYARKCELKEISFKESDQFLFDNHIQGPIKTLKQIGLLYKNELVSVMTFNKSRFNKNFNYELTRFCNKRNTTIIGGFAKLVKYFIRNYSNSIISYADRRYSNGNIYLKNNFKLINRTDPNYFYVKKKKDILENRIKYQKHKLSKILPIFDPILTEWENMQLNGYDRIHDCGNLVFVYNKEKYK